MRTLDYYSRTLKIFLFFFNFTTNFIVNALFFDEDLMHIIYIEKGSFNFIYNLPQILYSSFISGLINSLIKLLALSYSIFTEMKNINNKSNKNIAYEEARKSVILLKIKFGLFSFFCFILLILFWIYLACFCAVYKNTQIYLIKDTLISFGTSMIYPFLLYLFPGIFRIYALKGKSECIYVFSKIIQII